MDEAVSEGLPEPPMQQEAGNKAEAEAERDRGAGKGHLPQQQGKIGEDVEQHKAAGGAAEAGEGKRTGSESGHRREQGKRWSRRVSWGAGPPASPSRPKRPGVFGTGNGARGGYVFRHD